MTWEYSGLQGVTGGYKGLQGVTGGDKGLQGVTKDYRNFFLTRTFPDTFSCSLLYKKSKLKKSQTFDRNDGLTPLEKCQFCGFLKPMFSLLRMVCLVYKMSKIVFWGIYFHDVSQRNTGGYKGYRGLKGVTGG